VSSDCERRGSKQRTTEEHESSQRATVRGQRVASDGRRSTDNEAASNEASGNEVASGGNEQRRRATGDDATSGVPRGANDLGRAQQADDAGRAHLHKGSSTRSWRQHIGEPLGREQQAAGNEPRTAEEHESGQRVTVVR